MGEHLLGSLVPTTTLHHPLLLALLPAMLRVTPKTFLAALQAAPMPQHVAPPLLGVRARLPPPFIPLPLAGSLLTRQKHPHFVTRQLIVVLVTVIGSVLLLVLQPVLYRVRPQ